ncbi:MAG: CRISPR-associated protein Cas4 [Promethearchaeota archaeon]
MENVFLKYFPLKNESWHEYEIGIYHVSEIGCSHDNLEPEEHYGPCLRKTYMIYQDILRDEDPSRSGIFEIGKIIHEIIQREYIEGHNAVFEFPLILNINDEITIKGSVDLLEFKPDMVIDIKTASDYTFPRSKYDFSPTYEDQIYIYTYILKNFVFKDNYFNPTILRLIYVHKHNLRTIEIDIPYIPKKAKEKFEDFIERAKKLHECLKNKTPPDAEPQKWCKYCPYLQDCINENQIVEKEGKKKCYIKKG